MASSYENDDDKYDGFQQHILMESMEESLAEDNSDDDGDDDDHNDTSSFISEGLFQWNKVSYSTSYTSADTYSTFSLPSRIGHDKESYEEEEEDDELDEIQQYHSKSFTQIDPFITSQVKALESTFKQIQSAILDESSYDDDDSDDDDDDYTATDNESWSSYHNSPVATTSNEYTSDTATLPISDRYAPNDDIVNVATIDSIINTIDNKNKVQASDWVTKDCISEQKMGDLDIMMKKLNLATKIHQVIDSNHTRSTAASTAQLSTTSSNNMQPYPDEQGSRIDSIHTRTSIVITGKISLDPVITLENSMVASVASNNDDNNNSDNDNTTAEEIDNDNEACGGEDDDSSAWFGFQENFQPSIAVLSPVYSEASTSKSNTSTTNHTLSCYSTDGESNDDDDDDSASASGRSQRMTTMTSYSTYGNDDSHTLVTTASNRSGTTDGFEVFDSLVFGAYTDNDTFTIDNEDFTDLDGNDSFSEQDEDDTKSVESVDDTIPSQNDDRIREKENDEGIISNILSNEYDDESAKSVNISEHTDNDDDDNNDDEDIANLGTLREALREVDTITDIPAEIERLSMSTQDDTAVENKLEDFFFRLCLPVEENQEEEVLEEGVEIEFEIATPMRDELDISQAALELTYFNPSLDYVEYQETNTVLNTMLRLVGINAPTSENRVCCGCLGGQNQDLTITSSIHIDNDDEEEIMPAEKKKKSKKNRLGLEEGCKEHEDNTSDEDDGGCTMKCKDDDRAENDVQKKRQILEENNDDDVLAHIIVVVKEQTKTCTDITTTSSKNETQARDIWAHDLTNTFSIDGAPSDDSIGIPIPPELDVIEDSKLSFSTSNEQKMKKESDNNKTNMYSGWPLSPKHANNKFPAHLFFESKAWNIPLDENKKCKNNSEEDNKTKPSPVLVMCDKTTDEKENGGDDPETVVLASPPPPPRISLNTQRIDKGIRNCIDQEQLVTKGILRKEGSVCSGRRIRWNEEQIANKEEKSVLHSSARGESRSICPLDKLMDEIEQDNERNKNDVTKLD